MQFLTRIKRKNNMNKSQIIREIAINLKLVMMIMNI